MSASLTARTRSHVIESDQSLKLERALNLRMSAVQRKVGGGVGESVAGGVGESVAGGVGEIVGGIFRVLYITCRPSSLPPPLSVPA